MIDFILTSVYYYVCFELSPPGGSPPARQEDH